MRWGLRALLVVRWVCSSITRRVVPDVVVAPSEALALRHQEAGLFANDIRTLRHPVPPSRSRPERALGPVTFGFLGQLTQVKGVSSLLAAFAPVRDRARLLVAGDGPLRREVEDAAGSHVTYLGWLDGSAKAEFLDRIDCLVVPSIWQEPAGLVVGEALAAGVPVIGATVGGIPEYVAPGCQSLLFPPGDVAALTARLIDFLERPHEFPVTVAHLPTWEEHRTSIEDAYVSARQQKGWTH